VGKKEFLLFWGRRRKRGISNPAIEEQLNRQFLAKYNSRSKQDVQKEKELRPMMPTG
jgi:hypothetical protein